MTRSYFVVYEKGPRNYSGDAPDVIGCGSVGDTIEQMRANMIEALEFHLEGLAEDKIPAPEAKTTAIDFASETPEKGIEHCIVEWLEVRLPGHISDGTIRDAMAQRYPHVHPDADLNPRAADNLLQGAWLR